MKAKAIIVLCTMFAVCQAYAQTTETENPSVEEATQVETPQVDTVAVDVESEAEVDSVEAENEGASQVNPFMTAFMENATKGKIDFYNPDEKVVLPLKGKFWAFQQLGISTIIGHDNGNGNDDALTDKQSDAVDKATPLSQINFGLNFDYTLTFVPGKQTPEGLELNQFGFAFQTGLVAAFDKERGSKEGVTSDLLWKFGLSVGAHKPLGVMLDFMVGSGKSSGVMYDLEEDPNNKDAEIEAEPYTAWCFKYGMQLSIKTNLFQTKIPNTDILVFARFVESVNPYDDAKLFEEQKLFNVWDREEWTFGISVRYRF